MQLQESVHQTLSSKNEMEKAFQTKMNEIVVRFIYGKTETNGTKETLLRG